MSDTVGRPLNVVRQSDLAATESTGSSILFDVVWGRAYNAETPSSADTVTLDFSNAVAGGVAVFVSDGTGVTISSSKTVYQANYQIVGEQSALFLMYDGSQVYASWLPGLPEPMTQLTTPTVTLTAGNASVSYSISSEDANATGGVLEYSVDDGDTWESVSGYVFATKTGSITGLTNGTEVLVRLQSTATGYIASEYGTDSATPVAPTPVTNTKSGSFNGSTSKIVANAHIPSIAIGNSGLTGADNPMSWSMWIKASEVTATQPLLTLQVLGGKQLVGLIKYASNHGTTPNQVAMVISDNDFANFISLLCSVPFLAADGWKHLAITYSGNKANTGIKAYVNGVLDASSTGGGGGTYTRADYSTSSRLAIGHRQITASTASMSGLLDEVSIWNTELTAADITDIYNSGVPGSLLTHGKSANLKLWLRLEDNVTDSSAVGSAFTATSLTYSTDVP